MTYLQYIILSQYTACLRNCQKFSNNYGKYTIFDCSFTCSFSGCDLFKYNLSTTSQKKLHKEIEALHKNQTKSLSSPSMRWGIPKKLPCKYLYLIVHLHVLFVNLLHDFSPLCPGSCLLWTVLEPCWTDLSHLWLWVWLLSADPPTCHCMGPHPESQIGCH